MMEKENIAILGDDGKLFFLNITLKKTERQGIFYTFKMSF